MTISPLTLARTPGLLASQSALTQLTGTQQQLLNVENQLSTGQLYSQPSDNPGDTAISMQLQRTLTQRKTYSSNLATAQSQLGEVDNSLSSLTSLIQQAQNIASTDVNSDVSDAQRKADSQVIGSIISQSLSIANTQFNGQYLYAGDKSTTPPYVSANGGVQFVGSSNTLKTAVDNNTTMAYSVNAADVFGATSSQVGGTADLTPNLAADTRIEDLRGATGAGVQLGSIQISNGTTTATVDLSHASAVSDIVNAINAAGVGGISASLSGQGITLAGGPGDDISVSDVGGTSTATQLGIASPALGAGSPVVGNSLQPNVTIFTQLSDLKAGTGIDPSGITITNGAQTAAISFAGLNTVGDMINAINASGTSVLAQIDPSGTGIDIVNPVQGTDMTISENGGTSAADLGVQSFSPATPLNELNSGQGVGIAPSGSDFAITDSTGTIYQVSLAGATTVQDVINHINTATSGTVTAAFSATTNGMELTDTTAGGGILSVNAQNGSTAAADLGLTQNAAVGNVLTGSDVNPIGSPGVFSNLIKLQRALLNGNQSSMTAAAQGLQNDYNQVVQARGSAGASVDEMQSRQDQLTTENTATQSLMSQLSDTDFTAAITKFETLQTSLQATLETTAKTLHLSLMDFLQ